MRSSSSYLSSDRYFPPDPTQRRIARELYEGVTSLPIISPHGHIDPRLLADEDASWGTPAELFVIPDHYICRMLHSQGIALEALGIEPRDGRSEPADHRRVWQLFADNIYLFRGTPSGVWLADELRDVFGIDQPLTASTANTIYDELSDKLARPEFGPRALFERFHIETLCTTDDASDSLLWHRAIKESGWPGDVRPTFRPDSVLNVAAPAWVGHLEALSETCRKDIVTASDLVQALADRRLCFREMGATATDHAVETAYTAPLEPAEADAILWRARRGQATADDQRQFVGHMLIEMAALSIDDGLTMQLHVGSLRNHDQSLLQRFGPDKGADIPVATEFTRNLRPLLDRVGNDARLTLILFTLDESCYARELAPLAGYYPALRLGPPWWFHDSLNGLARYLDQVIETAGIYNTVGFNDDARAFASIPARHDVWRRALASWLSGLVVRQLVDEAAAADMARELTYDLPKRAYRLVDT